MKSLITEQLGLYGWKNLEPVILAALATENPMLLIGKHGSAKSFILERISEALKLNYRFYNASLINYDDLVGIPIPSKDKKSLEYISNSTSIWDAEVVFIDEINRTKPELQNKLFPIIYDKRVQGIDLKKLKYRFAAMNPAYVDDEDEENENEVSYFGAMPLDPALVDRFPYIIEVPEWDDLTKEEKMTMLKYSINYHNPSGANINELINNCHENYEKNKVKLMEMSNSYILALMNTLENSFGYISSRRAVMLTDTFIAIHAARLTLNEFDGGSDEIDFKETMFLHITNTMPYIAYKKIDKTKLIAIANEAYQFINADENKSKLLELKSDRDKIIYLINHKNEFETRELSNYVLNCLSKLDDKERRAMSLITYLSLRDIKELPATTIETIREEIVDCFEIENCERSERMVQAKIGRRINEICANNKNAYHNNLLNSFKPDDYDDIEEVENLSKYFMKAWSELNYEQAA